MYASDPCERNSVRSDFILKLDSCVDLSIAMALTLATFIDRLTGVCVEGEPDDDAELAVVRRQWREAVGAG